MTNDAPKFRYDAQFANAMEPKWQRAWSEAKVYETPNPGQAGFDASRPKYYCLDMFPYPSGAGLHIGHPEGYTATDIICRYKRMTGHNVLHPMGWDAFGLPAEQYAIATGVHPAKTTRTAIDNFRRQLQRFGFSYDWSREFGTIDDGYYKWTQWIFVKLYGAWFDEGAKERRSEGAKEGEGTSTGVSPVAGCAKPMSELVDAFARGTRVVRFNPRADEVSESERAQVFASWGSIDAATQRRIIDSYRLAYRSETTVNWCPKLGTVLANDEVIDGKSERGGFAVLRKPMKQWMFRITAYADRLIDQLEGLDWPSSTKAMQREWIGRSEGAEIEFEVRRLSEPTPTTSTNAPHQFDADSRLPLSYADFLPCDPYPAGEPSPSTLIVQVRSLPHVMVPGATYFVTWNTHGWHLNDAGRDIVMRALMHFDGERCDVLAACVMSNHVHWIIRPRAGHELRDIVASVKRFSAMQVNKIENMSGSLWQEDAFDHVIRDAKWLGAFARYTARNPVEAKLCASVRDYRWAFVSEALRGPSDQQVGLGGHWRKEGVVEGEGVGSESRRTSLRVFTTRPDTLFGATYMVVAPEHELCSAIVNTPGSADDATRAKLAEYVKWARNRSDVERQESKEKTGAFTGVYAINSATGKQIPVWAADYVMMGYGTGAIMAVPGHDERDFEFAEKFGLAIVQVVATSERGVQQANECFSGDGVAINSASDTVSLNGLPTAEAKQKIIAWLEGKKIGKRRVNYKLRDWTFSRQRYWGEPFPIVYDAAGNAYPVLASHLPVMLPELADYAPVESDDPQPLLAKAKDWVQTTAGEAGVDPALLPANTPVTRETNTMPGSAGSSWYAIRYCDPQNADALVGADAEKYWMGSGISGGSEAVKEGKGSPRSGDVPKGEGVDLYLGGSEHAVGHLLYSRFWQNALHDLGVVSCKEPFHKLFHQGLITSFAYQRSDKSIVPVDEVKEVSEGEYVEIATGAKVMPIVTKMSKRYKNVINPDDVINEFGADTCRLYEMYMGPLDASKPWNPRDISGCYRFLQRAWRVCIDENTGEVKAAAEASSAIEKLLHRLIAKVGSDIERLAFNTAIAAMIEFVNAATGADKGQGSLTRDQMRRFAMVLGPFVPHLAEEIWSRSGASGSVVTQAWPKVDAAMLVDDEIEVPVSVNGKVKTRIVVPAGIAKDAKQLEAFAMAHAEVVATLTGKPVKKVIAVPGKMVNVVV
jgi:leucyl-tRNA synthetase